MIKIPFVADRFIITQFDVNPTSCRIVSIEDTPISEGAIYTETVLQPEFTTTLKRAALSKDATKIEVTIRMECAPAIKSATLSDVTPFSEMASRAEGATITKTTSNPECAPMSKDTICTKHTSIAKDTLISKNALFAKDAEIAEVSHRRIITLWAVSNTINNGEFVELFLSERFHDMSFHVVCHQLS
jgi:hypothetical protein